MISLRTLPARKPQVPFEIFLEVRYLHSTLHFGAGGAWCSSALLALLALAASTGTAANSSHHGDRRGFKTIVLRRGVHRRCPSPALQAPGDGKLGMKLDLGHWRDPGHRCDAVNSRLRCLLTCVALVGAKDEEEEDEKRLGLH